VDDHIHKPPVGAYTDYVALGDALGAEWAMHDYARVVYINPDAATSPNTCPSQQDKRDA
jgi:hypothetical protein